MVLFIYALFGYSCYLLPQCEVYLSSLLFVHAVSTPNVKTYTNDFYYIESSTKQYSFNTISSIAQGFFIILIVDKVIDLNEARSKNVPYILQNIYIQFLSQLLSKTHKMMSSNISEDPLDNQTSSRNHSPNPTDFTSPSLVYTKRSTRKRTYLSLFKFFSECKSDSSHTMTDDNSRHSRHPKRHNHYLFRQVSLQCLRIVF